MSNALIDRFGRRVEDLRISVTDRCNFRCVYCMPKDGLPWLPKERLLTFEEIVRLAGIFITCGVKTIRITGGEPTLRKDLPRLIAILREAAPGVDIAMTTNGFLLGSMAVELAEAGLDRVNVSIDSLMRHRFERITRRDALDQVLEGLQAAMAAGLKPIKINCVVVRGENDDEVADMATLARDTGSDVRFIEFMPLDADRAWSRDKVVSMDEILAAVGRRYELVAEDRGVSPAQSFRFADGGPGSIGVIPSVTAPFCDTCDRVRLTPDGQLRTCLFALKETNLRDLMRGGASDADVAEAIAGAVALKQEGHRIGRDGFVQPTRSMSLIGG